MKGLAILGSRNHEGQTASATDALLEGLTAEGWDVDRVFLPRMRIRFTVSSPSITAITIFLSLGSIERSTTSKSS